MELNRVNRFAKFYESNHIEQQKASGKNDTNSKQLTQDEVKMIHQEFPQSGGQKLSLYMSTGKTKIENPNAKGGNLDFKI